MSPFFALLQKELLEIIGDRQSRRGGLIQGSVLAVVLGVLSVKPEAWLAAAPAAVFFFAFLPGIAAGTVAADAFAGERERRTLETLLASPIDERTILLGKTAAAVAFGTLVGAVGSVVAVVTVSLTAHPFVPALSLVAGVLGASFVSSSLLGALAVVVSMHVSVARSAQQITSISAMVLLGLGAAAWNASGIGVGWSTVFGAQIGAFFIALVLLEVARATFRRDRFFASR
jgi:ABC-2 type transport system permease protein